jgi:hypothetical protein
MSHPYICDTCSGEIEEETDFDAGHAMFKVLSSHEADFETWEQHAHDFCSWKCLAQWVTREWKETTKGGDNEGHH